MTSTTALFVDTWGWLTLRDRREKHHVRAKKTFEDFVAGGAAIVTTDFVLDETLTLLFRRLRFKDKPEISFTDLCSMVVMRELKIRKILTEDKHFEHVGFGFELLP